MKLSTILGSLGGESKFSKGDLDRIQQHSSQELLEMLPKEGSLKVATNLGRTLLLRVKF
jgi:hypothetical protein